LLLSSGKKIPKRIKELQPDASNRRIANALGVSHQTIGRDTGPNGPMEAEKLQENQSGAGPNVPPQPLTGAEAAKLAERCEERKQRDLEAEQKRMELLPPNLSRRPIGGTRWWSGPRCRLARYRPAFRPQKCTRLSPSKVSKTVNFRPGAAKCERHSRHARSLETGARRGCPRGLTPISAVLSPCSRRSP
jgi:hypothetical protein